MSKIAVESVMQLSHNNKKSWYDTTFKERIPISPSPQDLHKISERENNVNDEFKAESVYEVYVNNFRHSRNKFALRKMCSRKLKYGV